MLLQYNSFTEFKDFDKDSLLMFQEVLLKHKIWKSKYYSSKHENFLCSFLKKVKIMWIESTCIGCIGFIEILDMIITMAQQSLKLIEFDQIQGIQ